MDIFKILGGEKKMKNVHILPTDKPSRFVKHNITGERKFFSGMIKSNPAYTTQHLFITSDEKIKEGDYIFSTKTNNLFKADSIEYLENHNMIEDFDKSFYINSKYAKKIILTTDQDLIKDGVQKIDDEFLEWFVKNPSCEKVEVKRDFADEGIKGITYYGKYFLIIPKEPKQKNKFMKTELEDAAENNWDKINSQYKNGLNPYAHKIGFIEGSKWQAEHYGLMEIELSHTKRLLASCEKALEDRDKRQETMYSEEEVLDMMFELLNEKKEECCITNTRDSIVRKVFEQFKKK